MRCIAFLPMVLLAQDPNEVPLAYRMLPSNLATDLDVAYGSGEDARHQKLDIVHHRDKSKARPAIVLIHGGGWIAGHKRMGDFPDIAATLARYGYVTASISYRFSTVKPFPSMIEDCKLAIRFLRANAGKYGIDASRIGATGASAGAHMAALLAVTQKKDGFDDYGAYQEYSSAVQAAVPVAGAYDYTAAPMPKCCPNASRRNFEMMLGGPAAEKKEVARLASPVFFLDKSDAPMLVVHGTRDTSIDVQEARDFEPLLQQAGIENELLILEGAPHGMIVGSRYPEGARRMRAFFDRRLKPDSDLPPGIVLETGVWYGDAEGPGAFYQRMDIWYSTDVARRRPAVVLIHGGGWRGGYRQMGGFPRIAENLARAGFVAASISYRLSTMAKFPAAVEDCKSAIRFLRANASRYGIDPTRIGVSGASAGFHLAAMAAFTGAGDGFDKGKHLDQASTVQAAVLVTGSVDLTPAPLDVDGKPPRDSVEASVESFAPAVTQWLGVPARENPAVAARASAHTYADSTDPPVLIIGGRQDPAWPGTPHSERLLRERGVRVEVLALDAPHGMGIVVEGRGWEALRNFFTARLKP